MFEPSTLLNHPRRWWAACMGFGLEALLVTGLVLVPLIWPQVIPRVAYITAISTPGPPPAAPHRGDRVHPQHHATARMFRTAGFFAPAAVPTHAIAIVDPPPQLGGFGVPGGSETGVEGGMPGVLGSVGPDLRPPPLIERPPEPVRPPAPATPAPIPRLTGGKVHLAEPIFRPEPLYPPLARSMRISGVVELIAVIGTDGRIKELRVSRGHPLLVRAAMDAVARWVYRPTTLNGVPVEVEAPITVTFKLN